jgi:hypothetical protein
VSSWIALVERKENMKSPFSLQNSVCAELCGRSPLIVHANVRELVNTANPREKKYLVTTKDFHRFLILRWPSASEATAHLRRKQRTVLPDETGAIEFFGFEHERKFGQVGYGRLVVARHCRLELDPERGEFRINFGGPALTRRLRRTTESEQQR